LSEYQTFAHTTHSTHACLLKHQLPFVFVCFDFEWLTKNKQDDKGENQLFKAASFVDSNGEKSMPYTTSFS
jgi:hypothetical protein